AACLFHAVLPPAPRSPPPAAGGGRRSVPPRGGAPLPIPPPHAGEGGARGHSSACELRLRTHGRIWPEPRTRYLKLHSCSTPTGPRACSRPVAMPISAPNPNSPPSANWVEALCSTIAESTSARNFSAVRASFVTIASVWCEP